MCLNTLYSQQTISLINCTVARILTINYLASKEIHTKTVQGSEVVGGNPASFTESGYKHVTPNLKICAQLTSTYFLLTFTILLTR